MARRTIKAIECKQANRLARVVYDTDWQEYTAMLMDVAQGDYSTYHTDDKQDAIDTANHWVAQDA